MLGRIVFHGFRASLLMWCVAFVLHAPFIHIPSWINGLALLAIFAICLLKCGIDLPRPQAALAGGLSGFVAGLINILLLGSMLVEQPADAAGLKPGAEGLSSDAWLRVSLFLVASTVAGALIASIGRVLAAPRDAMVTRDHGSTGPNFLPRFVWLMALAFFPLIIIGGWVTSADAGMSVKGWPGSGGAVMILYPLSLMTDGRVFLEHSHRLFGMLVGLTTLVGMIWILARERRAWVKALVIAIFVLVCVQGLLGGKRVTMDARVLGMLHGLLAQIIFALAMVLAASFTTAFVHEGPARPHRSAASVRTLAMVTLGAFVIQLAFGAAYRHLGVAADGTPKPGGQHAIYAHAGFAIVVALLAAITGFKLKALAREIAGGMGREAKRVSGGLTHGVLAQFVLGWITFAVLMTSDTRGVVPGHEDLHAVPHVPLHEQLLATAHQGLGAILFATAALAVVWSWRMVRSEPQPIEPNPGTPAQ